MYEKQKRYLHWIIRVRGILKWLYPKKLLVRIIENPQFTRDSPYFITVGIDFIVEGRRFRVAVPTSIKFENLDELPEAFLKAYVRTLKKIAHEKLMKECDEVINAHNAEQEKKDTLVDPEAYQGGLADGKFEETK